VARAETVVIEPHLLNAGQ
jgi:hypothetical protein